MSKYVTEEVITSNSLQVAKWDVSAVGKSYKNIWIVSGNSITNKQNYYIDVTSNSEVAADYSIVISGINADIKASIDGGAYISAVGGKITLTNANCTFDANDTTPTHTHKITFMAPDGISAADKHDITLDVVFLQKEIN